MEARLKPQDVVVALALVAHPGEKPGYRQLAARVGMSASEVHAALKRLRACRLYSPVTERVSRAGLQEFLQHGIRYVFPAEEGERVQGTPTAWSASPLRSRLLVGEGDAAVWPSTEGETFGRRVVPLHAGVPAAARRDPALHEWLALADAMRSGRIRERRLASEELERRLAS